jgi:hypothetical protein
VNNVNLSFKDTLFDSLALYLMLNTFFTFKTFYMKLLKLYVLLGVFAAFSSCKPDPVAVSTNFKINGFAQKGPFTIGSKVTVSELTSQLIESGRNFNGTIADDKGSFTVEGSGLTSNFIAVSADGFYFDEVTGQLSPSRLILNALVDLSQGNTLNVNILTHLEFERVKFLLKSGQSFSQAKEQAKKEVLNIFKITTASSNFEKLDISKTEDENAALLAISAILQGTHTVAQLSELLSKISLDIKEDGKLDAENLKADLLNQATILNTAKVRTNLSQRLKDIGVTTTIGNFEKFVTQFIKATAFTNPNQINYPKTGVNGYLNLLALSDTILPAGSNYSFASYLPDGASLKIIIRTAPGQGILFIEAYGGLTSGLSGGTPTAEGTRTYLSTTTTPNATVTVSDVPFQIEIYENGATTPTRVITFNTKGSSEFLTFDQTGKYGKNIFPQLGSNYPKGDNSFQVKLNDTKEHTVKFEFYYNTKQDMLFSNLEGWTMVRDTSNANIVITRLEFKATKATADMKISLVGSSNATAQGWVDGVLKNEWYKKMSW